MRYLRLVTFLSCLMMTGSLLGAELRNTLGEQKVYRQVAVPQKYEPTIYVDSPVQVGEGDCVSCGSNGCELCSLRFCGQWAEFEYLLWWRRGRALPPLITTSPDNTPLDQAGVLGQPETSVLFGGDRFGEDARPGGRVTVGSWLDAYQCNALVGRFWALGEETVRYNTTSNGSPILARPFNNQDPLIGPLGNTSRPLAFPGVATNGSVTVTSTSDVLGGDALFRSMICDTGCMRVEFLAGYQFSRIDEDLIIQDSLVDDDPNNIIIDGTRQDITDMFRTRNQFHGGQLGLDATYFGACWRLQLLAKVGLGNVNQRVTIMGQTVNDVPNDPNSPVMIQEGLLANSMNQGTFERDRFAVVPEIGANWYYQITDCMDLSFGYTFIYWNNIAQPGDQIDQALRVPSQFTFADSGYWVHGLNAGLSVRF